MKKLLTIRKQKWANKFKPNLIRSHPLNCNMGVAASYNDRLDDLITPMIEETERELKKLFNADHAEEFFAQDASIASQARILTNALIEKYEKIYDASSISLAEFFADQSDKSSSAATHAALEQLSGGLSLPTKAITGDLKDIVKATTTENVALIRSIPQQYLSGVQQAVMRSITTKQGAVQLIPYLLKHKNITYARARIISLDQTRKAFEAMSRERAQRAGVKEFEWVHTGGGHEPRPLHLHTLNGKVFSYDNPPVIDERTGERGFPGQLINCKCRQRLVINFGDRQ